MYKRIMSWISGEMTAEQDLANYGRIPAWQPISGSGPLIKFQIFKDNRAEKTL